MAYKNWTYDECIKIIKKACVLKINYNNTLFNIGYRDICSNMYYCLNCNTLEVQCFIGFRKFIKCIKIYDKHLSEIWNDVEIINIYFWIDYNEEITVIEQFIKNKEI